MVLEDLNAQIGTGEYINEVAGKHHEKTNDNSMRSKFVAISIGSTIHILNQYTIQI